MKDKISRRTFGRLAGAAAGIAAIQPNIALGQMESHAAQGTVPNEAKFPQDFVWGSATASYQVEGAVKEDGRGTTIWDTFSHTPGKVKNGDTGDVADDYYHRYPQDIAMMKELGLTGCRFSLAWSRIQPTGTGAVNEKGLDFYKRMVDELLKNNITPYCTLYHWDLPQPLQDRGGWENMATVRAFGEFAVIVAKNFSDRIKNFMTMNEIPVFTTLGYENGEHAPGLKLDRKRVAQVCHHAILGHGTAVEALRAHSKGPVQIGLADATAITIPIVETEANIKAAEAAFREENARYLNAILTGKYTERYLKGLGADAPKFTAAEMKTISAPIDFVGLNIYTGHYVTAADTDTGYKVLENPTSFPHTLNEWSKVTPESLYWGPAIVHRNYGVKAIYITENGCASNDTLQDGHVYDTDRVMYLRNYLGQLQRGIADGNPVKGYFLWSLLDNFEWAQGYTQRFGIVYVDFASQKRTWKQSAYFYQEMIRRGGMA